MAIDIIEQLDRQRKSYMGRGEYAQACQCGAAYQNLMVARYGKDSLEAAGAITWISQSLLAGYCANKNIVLLQEASKMAARAIQIYENGQPQALVVGYAEALLMLAEAITVDMQQPKPVLLLGEQWAERAKLVAGLLKQAAQIASSLADSDGEAAKVYEQIQEALARPFPRPKPHYQERYFWNDDLGEFAKLFIDKDTNEVLFDVDQICRLFGITRAEADKIVPEHEKRFIDNAEIIREPS